MKSGGSLVVAGTGIQWAGQTTLAARRAIEQADQVLYAVAGAGAAKWVTSLNSKAEQLHYPTRGRRREIYLAWVEHILEPLREGRRVCAVFYGHPGVFTDAAHDAIRRAREEGFAAQMLPGVSALACLFADLGVDPGQDGCQVFEATNFLIRPRSFDVHTPLILFQIGAIGNVGVFEPEQHSCSRAGLETLATALRRSYPAAHEVTVYEAAVHPIEPPRIDRFTLGELPAAPVSAISTLYVPPLAAAPSDSAMVESLGMNRNHECAEPLTETTGAE